MSKLCLCRCGVKSWRPSCTLNIQGANHVRIGEYHKLTVTLSGAPPERTRSSGLGPACVMHKATDTRLLPKDEVSNADVSAARRSSCQAKAGNSKAQPSWWCSVARGAAVFVGFQQSGTHFLFGRIIIRLPG